MQSRRGVVAAATPGRAAAAPAECLELTARLRAELALRQALVAEPYSPSTWSRAAAADARVAALLARLGRVMPPEALDGG